MKSISTYLEEINFSLKNSGFCYIRVKASPLSKKDNISVMSDGITLKVNLKSEPKYGKANTELSKKLEQLIGTNSKSKIINGEHSNLKLIKITI